MENYFSTEIIEEKTSTGVPMLSFVVDEIYKGKRMYIRETFIHDLKNRNYDRARQVVLDKRAEMIHNICEGYY